jgi:hypothetical protein
VASLGALDHGSRSDQLGKAWSTAIVVVPGALCISMERITV